MAASIKKLREARYLDLSDVASKIGVTEIELKRMERRWDDPSPTMVRDLAILFDCDVREILGKTSDDDPDAWPYALAEYDNEEFGGVYLEVVGKELSFALTHEQAGRISHQMEELGFARQGDKRPWLSIDTMCGRLLFINPGAVRSLVLKHDDDEATPYYAHPEVYCALYDTDTSAEQGPVTKDAMAEAISLAGDEETASEDQRRIKILYLDGTVDHRYLNDDWVGTAIHGLMGHSFSVPPNLFLQVEREGGYVNGWINLSQIAMLDVPYEKYLRLTSEE